MNKISYIIDYRNLESWDISLLDFNNYSNYDLIELNNLVTKKNKKINSYDFQNEFFDILGISNKVGMFDKYTKNGRELNQILNIVSDKNIVYNPYRINIGSVGIKDKNIKGKYVSSSYIVLECNNFINPEYLYLVMTTEWFINQTEYYMTGNFRKYLSFDSLCKIKIPLPDLVTQTEIVDNYKKNIEKVNKIHLKTNDEINDYFLDNLKINNNFNIYNKILVISLSNLNDWMSWENYFDIKSKYDIVKFKEIILGNHKYGTIAKQTNEVKDYRLIRPTDIKNNGELDSKKVYPEYIDDNCILKQNDFLISNSGFLVGKIFLYDDKMDKAVFSNNFIRYKLNINLINPKFLFYYCQSSIFKTWMNQNKKGLTKKIDECPIVLPPLNIQNKIVREIDGFIDQNKINETKIKEFKNTAIKQLNNKLFN